MDKPTQKLLPFAESNVDPRPESHLDAVRYEPSDESLAAFERLEGRLPDPGLAKLSHIYGQDYVKEE